MDRLRAGLKDIEEKIKGFDAKVADEFESLIGHPKHTPPHLTGAEPSTAETVESNTYGTTAATGEALKNDGPIAPLTPPGTPSTPVVTPAPAPAAP